MMNSLNWKQKEMPLELDKEKEAKFEESITERTKLRKQKSNEKESDEQLHTKDMRHLETKESAVERRKKEQGLKILTRNRILRTSPISLAQLKTGNNSEKLNNEIRQLFVLIKKAYKNHLKARLTLYKDGNNFYEQQK